MQLGRYIRTSKSADRTHLLSSRGILLACIFALLVATQPAHAEGSGGGGGCGGCGKGGGKEGGGGGGGGGGGAGEILMGIAAIIAPIAAAAAQVAAAKEKANADKFIAKTSADAAIKQTSIQAETTRELAQNQKEVAEANTQATKELAEKQRTSQEKNLMMQLSALEKEREKASSERAEIRAIEEKRAQETILIAKQQAERNMELAKLAVLNKTVQDGLIPSSTNSGARLSTTNIASTRGQPSTASTIQSQSANSGGSNNPIALGVTAERETLPSLGSSIATNSARGALGSENVVKTQLGKPEAQDTRNTPIANRKPSPAPIEAASASLLSSVRSDFARNFNGPRGAAATLNPVIPNRFASDRMRGVLSRTGRGLASALASRHGMIGGSTRGIRQRVDGLEPQNSGLREFAQAIDRSHEGVPHVLSGRPTQSPGMGRVNNGHGVQSYSLGSSRGRGLTSE